MVISALTRRTISKTSRYMEVTVSATVHTVATIIRYRLRTMVENNNPVVLAASYLLKPEGKRPLMVVIMVMMLSKLRIRADKSNIKSRS